MDALFGIGSGAGDPLRLHQFHVTQPQVLASQEPSVLLTAVGLLALAIAATAGTADGGQGPWPYVAAALFAAGAAWLPVKAAHAS